MMLTVEVYLGTEGAGIQMMLTTEVHLSIKILVCEGPNFDQDISSSLVLSGTQLQRSQPEPKYLQGIDPIRSNHRGSNRCMNIPWLILYSTYDRECTLVINRSLTFLT